MSLKRFQGWTPTPADPVEWDGTEQAWMLALNVYESGLCPLCGMSVDFCHDQDKVEHAYRGAQVELCFVSQLREQAMRDYEASGSVDTHAQTTSLMPRPRTSENQQE
ncbi:hypothetical protein [Bifidobacterium scardovii]|uniref:Phage terminase protein large subunit-like protein n=1 Tax=Bifidobacterium scardovii TaxID=158787 RepID=A0A087DGM7_9BIFI|nr:hypothetical protein [Bifidobacterium scardovii]KFI94677.1 phage terminase protein large subunit-like protein [Bifidobacterium scardovii]MDK6349815.1 hypothetical protein [Bifidobacterium scardovii]MDU8982519.1 hypothetical protein [Bifidobacterium scardovii]